MLTQVRSIMCGCGNCQIAPSPRPPCPLGNSKDAIQLWHSKFDHDEEETSSTEPEGEECSP
jgi:hypothetical protein